MTFHQHLLLKRMQMRSPLISTSCPSLRVCLLKLAIFFECPVKISQSCEAHSHKSFKVFCYTEHTLQHNVSLWSQMCELFHRQIMKEKKKDLQKPTKLPWQEIRGSSLVWLRWSSTTSNINRTDFSGGRLCAPNKINHHLRWKYTGACFCSKW